VILSQTIALASCRQTISSPFDEAFAYLSRLPLTGTDQDDMHLGEGAGTLNDDVGKA
jgi:hypothetical protein